MASNSRKYMCFKCMRSARSTCRDIKLICGYCNQEMRYVRPYPHIGSSSTFGDLDRKKGKQDDFLG